jgi:hypothetical protein
MPLIEQANSPLSPFIFRPGADGTSVSAFRSFKSGDDHTRFRHSGSEKSRTSRAAPDRGAPALFGQSRGGQSSGRPASR